MPAVIAGLILFVVLVVSAAAKAVDGVGTRAALATYGVKRPAVAGSLWMAVVGSELLLALGLLAGVRAAAWATAALLAVFVLAQLAALARGRAGAPCGCLGARGRLSRGSVLRAAGLAGLALFVAASPRPALDTEQWLGIGLGFALTGLAALGVVVLALAREVGSLRLAISPQGALEVPHEGPEVGARIAVSEAFGDDLTGGRLGLAVFTSEGCAMCRALAPVVAGFGRHPHVALRIFDEVADAAAWQAADVPGSPYAVALDAGGAVLAKGTFNSGAQLESVLATAERRRVGRRTPSAPRLEPIRRGPSR